MPAIRDWAYELQPVATTTTLTAALPLYAAGDLILIVCGADTGAKTFTATGYNALTPTNHANNSLDILWKIAGAGESDPTVTINSAETWVQATIAIRDVHSTSPIHKESYGQAITQLQNMPTVTTTVDDCLLLWTIASDQATSTPSITNGPSVGLFGIDGTSEGLGLGYGFQPLAGTTSSSVYGHGNISEDRAYGTLAIAPPGDSYLETNYDTDENVDDNPTAIGQSFTANGAGVISSVIFYLKKSGSPTGNMNAKLYDHSGTYGTSSVPTGTVLATSDNFSISALTTSYQAISFKFSTGASLTNTTQYVIVLDTNANCTGANYVQVKTDASSPTHGGNMSRYSGSWSAVAGTDVCFALSAATFRPCVPISNGIEMLDNLSGTTISRMVGSAAANTANVDIFTAIVTSINSVTCTHLAWTAGADQGVNAFHAAAQLTHAVYSPRRYTGAAITLNVAKNTTDKAICVHINASTLKESQDNSYFHQEGIGLLMMDNSANNIWRAYKVKGQGDIWGTQLHVPCLIHPDATTTLGTGGSGTFDKTAINRIAIFGSPLTMTGTNTAIQLYSRATLVGETTFIGGTATNPIGLSDINDVIFGQEAKIMLKQGTNLFYCAMPIQVGDGANKTVFIQDSATLEFPRQADENYKNLHFHAPNNWAGITYYGIAGDTIKHTNSTIYSPSPFKWIIHASATSSATWDFSGLTIIGGAVTLRNVMTFTNMTFTNCPAIDISSCTISVCSISGAPAAGAGLTVNSSSLITSCTIDTTSVSSGNSFMSTGTPEDISSTAFTGSASTGHAIQITSTGTFSFSGNTFTSYGADGTNSAAIYNNSSGLVTLNITGGGSVPTIRNGTSATTVVNRPVDITIVVRDESNNNIKDARVAIQGTATSSMLGSVADDGGSQTVQTTASNNGTTNDMTLLPATPATNDAYYFGSAEPFYKLTVNIGTNGVGSWTILWEYYNGSSWATIPDVNDQTTGFSAGTGSKDVTFSPPTAWTTTTVQSISAFWVRARVSAYTSVTTQPLGTQAWVYHQIMNELTRTVSVPFTVGTSYTIVTVGTTDFTAIGAASNTIGVTFTATGVGTGDGTATDGVATESFNYLSDTSVTIRVRKSSTGTTKYVPVNTTGTILSTGFSLTQTMIVDANVDLT